MARGIADFVDTVTLRRESGGTRIIRLKTFEMDRKAWQGEGVDEVWLERTPATTWSMARPGAADGNPRADHLFSMTPMLGVTPIRKRFKEQLGAGCAEILMRIDDAVHIPPDRIKPRILARYKASERATRAYGADMQGEGAVFEIPEEAIKHSRDPATFPLYWPWLWAVDFSHGGMSARRTRSPRCSGCWDRDSDVIYIVHAIRMRQALPIQHVAAIKAHPCWDAPWPGRMTAALPDSRAPRRSRRPKAARPQHAADARDFPDGGYNFESGIAEMEQRFATGRLKIAQHLGEVFDEYRGYHRVNGLVHKVDDDLMSAIRVLCMDIRFAKALIPIVLASRAHFAGTAHLRVAASRPVLPRGSTSICSPGDEVALEVLVDEQDYNDSGQNKHPIGNLSACY